uniref:Uncharacterized protein n=1 Tax=Cacopsylla melanoneura TaxID=428564 RepID=A0A8D8X3H0_9HEMI
MGVVRPNEGGVKRLVSSPLEERSQLIVVEEMTPGLSGPIRISVEMVMAHPPGIADMFLIVPRPLELVKKMKNHLAPENVDVFLNEMASCSLKIRAKMSPTEMRE